MFSLMFLFGGDAMRETGKIASIKVNLNLILI